MERYTICKVSDYALKLWLKHANNIMALVMANNIMALVMAYVKCSVAIKMLGLKRIECVLPKGTPLTGVGETVKGGIGTVWVRRPLKGPFYVSHITIDKLIAHLVIRARLCTIN